MLISSGTRSSMMLRQTFILFSTWLISLIYPTMLSEAVPQASEKIFKNFQTQNSAQNIQNPTKNLCSNREFFI